MYQTFNKLDASNPQPLLLGQALQGVHLHIIAMDSAHPRLLAPGFRALVLLALVFMCLRMPVCMHMCIYMRVYACEYVNIFRHTCIHAYTHA